MSFAQQSGPPASAKQIAHLLSLLNNDGFDFATARHRYGLTQRQSRGKFTGSEATELIDRLTREAEGGDDGAQARFDDPVAVKTSPRSEAQLADSKRAASLSDFSAESLADELQRRGWAVIPPL